MFEFLSFPASGIDRERLVYKAREAEKIGLEFKDMTDDQKLAYVLGMQSGYYQGRREMKQSMLDRLTAAAVGFKP